MLNKACAGLPRVSACCTHHNAMTSLQAVYDTSVACTHASQISALHAWFLPRWIQIPLTVQCHPCRRNIASCAQHICSMQPHTAITQICMFRACQYEYTPYWLLQCHPEKTALCTEWQTARDVASLRQVRQAFTQDGSLYAKRGRTTVRFQPLLLVKAAQATCLALYCSAWCCIRSDFCQGFTMSFQKRRVEQALCCTHM